MKNGTHYYTEGIPFEREYVEFIRVDVFIKKARKYLYKTLTDNCEFDTITLNEYIEDDEQYVVLAQFDGHIIYETITVLNDANL